jgi:hypothetical protein
MLKRLKQALVESYIGAVALGTMLAQGIYSFVGIFADPVGNWLSEKEVVRFSPNSVGPTGISFQYSLPSLIRSLLTLVIWYVLVRWLYFPANQAARQTPTDQEK